MADEQKEAPVPAIRHESGFVHYGLVEDGVFHPVASERQGDYNERIEAHKNEEESE